MTTEALIKSCLKFPFMLEIYAVNNQQYGFQYTLENFNGLQELFKRSDAPSALLKAYRETIPEDVLKLRANPVQAGSFSFELSFLEIMLAQRDIIRRLDAQGLKTLASECIAKARLLESQQKYSARNSNSRTLLEEGVLYDVQALSELYQATQLFAHSHTPQGK